MHYYVPTVPKSIVFLIAILPYDNDYSTLASKNSHLSQVLNAQSMLSVVSINADTTELVLWQENADGLMSFFQTHVVDFTVVTQL